MLRFAATIIVVSLSLLTATFAVAQTIQTDISAQYRPRLEVDKRFAAETGVYVTHRARLAFGLQGDGWRVRIEPQDVRAWGSEASPVAYAANVDLHQGFAEWNSGQGTQLRIGRQSIAHLNQRLIGGLNWAQQGRSFDAVRLSGSQDRVRWDIWTAPLADTAPRRSRDGAIATGLLQWDNAGRRAALLAVGDMNRDARLYRTTTGLHTSGKLLAPLGYQAEAYVQVGHREGEEIRAYLAKAEVRYTVADHSLKPTIRVGYDVLSGQTDDTTAFDTLHGTNHAFYGFMDAFLNLPAHTGGLGLQDLYVRATATLGTVRTYLAIHHLRTGPGNEGTFGTEVDLVATVPVAPGVTWETGAAVLLADDAFATVRPTAPTYPLWGYSMLNVALQ